MRVRLWQRNKFADRQCPSMVALFCYICSDDLLVQLVGVVLIRFDLNHGQNKRKPIYLRGLKMVPDGRNIAK